VRNDVRWESVRYRGVVSDVRPSRLVGYFSFVVTLRASHLHPAPYSSRQEELHSLIQKKHQSGMGYRKIAESLNEQGYKTERGHSFKNTHVYSILKKKRARDDRLKKRYDWKMGFVTLVLV